MSQSARPQKTTKPPKENKNVHIARWYCQIHIETNCILKTWANYTNVEEYFYMPIENSDKRNTLV